MTTIQIRDAREDDLPGLLAIYNDVVASSTAIYRDTPASLDDRRDWWQARVAAHHPVLVAIDDHGVAGFASYGEFRVWPGYRYTVEHSVHIRHDRRGQGLGTALMTPLLEHAREQGMHVMVAGIDADNHGSIVFHERLGFERVAHMREVGFKFGRWLDLVLLQKIL
ncbi:MAG: GNAT family N-acetyltransferase [Acidobacteriaceae bacterium]|jgi:phosphinothricin acetyltransferase|nr:GNAT family N-acetyltransferase [Acidobacteriaceae bacterium]